MIDSNRPCEHSEPISEPTRQEAIDKAARRIVTPAPATGFLQDVDDAKIPFENFPVTIAVVRTEYRKILDGSGACNSAGQPLRPWLSCSVATRMPLCSPDTEAASSKKNKGEIRWNTGSSLGL